MLAEYMACAFMLLESKKSGAHDWQYSSMMSGCSMKDAVAGHKRAQLLDMCLHVWPSTGCTAEQESFLWHNDVGRTTGHTPP